MMNLAGQRIRITNTVNPESGVSTGTVRLYDSLCHLLMVVFDNGTYGPLILDDDTHVEALPNGSRSGPPCTPSDSSTASARPVDGRGTRSPAALRRDRVRGAYRAGSHGRRRPGRVRHPAAAARARCDVRP
jgi:hypothetical protein